MIYPTKEIEALFSLTRASLPFYSNSNGGFNKNTKPLIWNPLNLTFNLDFNLHKIKNLLT